MTSNDNNKQEGIATYHLKGRNVLNIEEGKCKPLEERITQLEEEVYKLIKKQKVLKNYIIENDDEIFALKQEVKAIETTTKLIGMILVIANVVLIFIALFGMI